MEAQQVPPSLWSFAVVAAIVTSGGTLLGHILKEVALARSFEAWKQRRALGTLYRKYRDPLVLSAIELANRLVEILEEHPADFLGPDVLAGSPPEPSHGAERDRYFLRYKYQSTVYRLTTFLGWVELYRQDLVFLDTPSQGVTATLQYVLQRIRGDLADGHLNEAENWTDYTDALIFREEQRAIGEAMITSLGETRTVAGYGSFVALLENRDSQTRRWLQTAVNFLAEPGSRSPDFRLERYRRLLVHLVDLVNAADKIRVSVRLKGFAQKYAALSAADVIG